MYGLFSFPSISVPTLSLVSLMGVSEKKSSTFIASECTLVNIGECLSARCSLVVRFVVSCGWQSRPYMS